MPQNSCPIVIGGGACAYNPEPMAAFFDLFYIGEGETVYDALFDAYKVAETPFLGWTGTTTENATKNLKVEKILPAIYTYCGYRAGSTMPVSKYHKTDNQKTT